MKILYITNALPRPTEAGGSLPWRQATFLAQAGHQVTVITSQRHYLTDEVISANTPGALIKASWETGLQILSVKTSGGRRKSLRHRIINYLSFTLGALWAGIKAGKSDLVYVRTPPILIPLTGFLLAKYYRCRFIIDLGDLHPDEAVNLGLIKSPGLINLWEWMENFFRRRADLLFTVVPGIKRLLMQKGYAPESIFLSTYPFEPLEERREPLLPETVAQLKELRDRFVIMYTGTIGLSQALEVGLQTAELLQKTHPQIHFLFVGKGDKLPRLQQAVADKHLINVSFMAPVPWNAMGTLLQEADAVMHLVYPGEVHGCYYFPHKIFEYLGSGKPIIYSGTGEIATLIQEARCGLATPPEDARAFAQAAIYLYQNQEEGGLMGQRGYEYVRCHFNREEILTTYTRRLERLNGKET